MQAEGHIHRGWRELSTDRPRLLRRITEAEICFLNKRRPKLAAFFLLRTRWLPQDDYSTIMPAYPTTDA